MKIIAIIQARMDSSRLPGKVMMKFSKMTILEHIIENLENSELTDKIIVATTSLEEDKPLKDLVQKIGIPCYCGSPENVLARYYKCAKFFNGDLIIRVTGDSPLIDSTLTDKAINISQDYHCDYVSNILHLTYPLGYNSGEVIPFRILKNLYNSQKDKQSKEHVTFHIRKNPELYKIKEILAPKKLRRPQWRLTVDYYEDYKLMKKIFSKLYKPHSTIKYDSLVKFLDIHPELLKINQKYSINIKKENINPVKDELVN